MTTCTRIKILLLAALLMTTAQAEEIATTDILSRTSEATLACAQWTPVGLCFWLKCTYFSCDVETSLKIGQVPPLPSRSSSLQDRIRLE